MAPLATPDPRPLARCMLLWALPDSLDSFDLLDPDLERRIAARLQSRLGATGPAATNGDRLAYTLAAQAGAAREAGVVLWAFHGKGSDNPDDPLSVISLTLAVRQLPAQDRPVGPGTVRAPPGTASATVTPLPLGEATTAFCRDSRQPLPVVGGGRQAAFFHRQVFVVPDDYPIVAVVAVSTPDPALESDCRELATQVAATLAFVPVAVG